LIIDPDEEKITYKAQEIELKGKPFEVLTHLARHSDQIGPPKSQLLDAILGKSPGTCKLPKW